MATPEYGARSETEETKISVLDMVVQMLRRKHLILRIAFVGLLAGIGFAYLGPKKYQAVTKLMPPRQEPSAATLLINQLSSTSNNPFSSLGSALGKTPNDIYIGILSSRPVADAIIGQFQLQHEYHAKDMTTARKQLAANTSIESDKSGLFVISVTDKDKNRVARIANAYTGQLRAITQKIGMTEASRRLLYYQGQLGEAKDALVNAEVSFQNVQQKKGLVQLDDQTKVMIEGLANLRAQIAAKEVQAEALSSYATENNPQLMLAEKELASLRSEMGSMEQRNSSSGINMSLQQAPSAGLEYVRAQRELQYRQALYDLLLKQYEAAQLDESKDATVIQVVEPAVAPERPAGLGHLLKILISAIAGFALGCLFALVSWWKEEILQSDPEAASQLRQIRKMLTGAAPKSKA